MSQNVFSRRALLRDIVSLPAVGSLLTLAGCAKNAVFVCADPNNLTSDEVSLRVSLHYSEESPDAQKTCSGCGFFSQPTPQGCGGCQMLHGIVNGKGHCDSWSART